jgi:hypothetical protein
MLGREHTEHRVEVLAVLQSKSVADFMHDRREGVAPLCRRLKGDSAKPHISAFGGIWEITFGSGYDQHRGVCKAQISMGTVGLGNFRKGQ